MPTKILFGAGSLDQLATYPLPGKKALIVCGGKSVKSLGYLARVQELLEKNGCSSAVFDKIQPNPTVEHVMEGASLARAEACDMIIGLGGGSSMDSAKSIALMATNPGHYWDYIQGGSGKGQTPSLTPLPIIAITTTAGTGTEADPWTVITKEDTHEKIGFGYEKTFPTLSIVDPELMTSVPPQLTAFQGFDAFFHALEGYTATIANPISDMYALQSITHLLQYLPVAIEDGGDLIARSHVALANTLSGFVESLSCCTSEHSIEHALSAHNPTLPHGAGLIMIAEAYHRTAAQGCPDRYAHIAKIMGEEQSVEGFLRGLRTFKRACKVDTLRLSDYGFLPEKFAEYIRCAQSTMGGLFALDRHSFTEAELITILKDSY